MESGYADHQQKASWAGGHEGANLAGRATGKRGSPLYEREGSGGTIRRTP